mmetsp:Transcript_3868/g.5160  ORF Transcript_3868/g.5160 Transcript_3868/m.5160 type:complete len:100 (+) Transcript_3868:912-1211(+)
MTISDSPAVLVIRSKKHSLDANEVSEQLEAETYTLMPGTVAWTKATLLKETNSKQLNRRGLTTLEHFSKLSGLENVKDDGDVEEMVRFYNANEHFQQSN